MMIFEPGSRYVVVFCVMQRRSEKVVPLSFAALPVPLGILAVLTMSASRTCLPLTVSNLHLLVLGLVVVSLNGPFFPPPLFHVIVAWTPVPVLGLKFATSVAPVAGPLVQPVNLLVDVPLLRSVLNVAFVQVAGVAEPAGAAKPTAIIEVAASPRASVRMGRN